MPFRYPLRTMVGATLCSLPVVVVACGGRGPLDTDIAAYDAPDAAGLLGDDAGGVEPGVDSGARPGRSPDSGKQPAKDAGVPGLPGFPGLGADAGPAGACFTCAQAMCGTQVTACASSPTCVEEGFCDLMTCLGGSGTTPGGAGAGLGGLDLACLQKCGSDSTASQELMSALLCVFGSCGSPCLGAITSLGSSSGGGGLTGFPGLTPPSTK